MEQALPESNGRGHQIPKSRDELHTAGLHPNAAPLAVLGVFFFSVELSGSGWHPHTSWLGPGARYDFLRILFSMRCYPAPSLYS